MSEKLIFLLFCYYFCVCADFINGNISMSPLTGIKIIRSNSFSVNKEKQNLQADKLQQSDQKNPGKINIQTQTHLENEDERKSEIFDLILGNKSKYNNNVRPSGIDGHGPVHIHVSIEITSLDNIDDVKNEYSVQMNFHQEWMDPRLIYSDIENNIEHFYLQDHHKVWEPDLYFVNEKKALIHDILRPNIYTMIYKDGRVCQGYRITLLASCIFDLHSFPLDVQSCPVNIATLGWSTKDLIIVWDDHKIGNIQDIRAAKFHLRNFSAEAVTKTDWRIGNYSSIKLNLKFEREIGFYLIQIYFPCGMLVITSWVSFWLEPSAMEARVSVGVTTILTMVTQTYGINQTSPPASYVKALDVWTTFCQAMVFAVLLQFSLVNYISHNRKKISDSSRESEVGVMVTRFDGMNGEDLKDIMKKQEIFKAKKATKNISMAKRIDIACRVIFPSIFILFNIIYWSTYVH